MKLSKALYSDHNSDPIAPLEQVVTFTRYTSTEPQTKRYWLEGGITHKQATPQMSKGNAERVTLPFSDFPEALIKATDKHAFGYGSLPLNYPNKVKIVVKGKEQPDKNILSRTKTFFEYRNEPGLVMFDHDWSNYGQTLTADALLATLSTIHSSIAQAARVVRGSVSAGVHKVGESLRTDKGFHVYIPVTNADDIPRYGQVMFDRLWLAGLGYIALASNGAMLERACIDAAVFSPERLDFVATPIISGAGLDYTPPVPEYTEGGLLDTETLLDLTEDEQAEVKRLIAEAKEAIKPAAAIEQQEWTAAKVETMTAAGVPIEKARKVIYQILNGDCKDLYDDFLLEFTTGAVSVSEVLKNPKAYDGKALADPIEGSAKGFTKAMFYWNKGVKPFIHSFAHGESRYFLHQSETAKNQDWERALLGHVEKFNMSHASVLIGGKHKIMRKVKANATNDGRVAYEFFTRNELSLVHDNTLIQSGFDRDGRPVYKNHLLAWAKHPKSRSYTGGVVFLPGRDVPANYFNTWRGFSVEPQQNDDLLKPIYYHMREVVCGGHQDLYDYFINWIAYTVQHPDKPAGAAIVLRGEKGSGKGTVGHFLKSLWGNHGLHISNAKHLIGNFNAHLADVCFLFADEAFYSGDKQHEGVLKSLVTEPCVTIERKGIDAISQPNYLKILMATNSNYAVPASRDERRYCVMDVAPAHIGDRVYFNELYAACESRAVQSAFLYAMQNHDLTGWHTGDIPESVGLREQRYHSLGSVQKWLVDCLNKGCFKGDVGEGGFPETVHASVLYEAFVAWCDDNKLMKYDRITQTMFGRYLSAVYQKRRNSSGQYVYYFGLLPDARLAFEVYEKICLDELET